MPKSYFSNPISFQNRVSPPNLRYIKIFGKALGKAQNMEIRNNIIHRPEISNKYNDMPSLGHMLVKNLTDAGEKTLLVNGITGEKLSAINILKKSVKIAKGLLAAGLHKGDIVATISENRVDLSFIFFGAILNNCIMAPINNTYSVREITHALNLSKPKIIFVSKSLSENVVKIAKSLDIILKVILIDNDVSTDKIAVQLKDFLSPRIMANVHFEPQAVNTKETCCFIMCSSGTTGLPKGVQISQNNIIVTARSMESTILCDSNVGTGERVILGLLPLFHVFGAVVLTCTVAATLLRKNHLTAEV